MSTDSFLPNAFDCLAQLLRFSSTAATEHLQKRFEATLDKIRCICLNERTPYTLNDHYFFNNRAKFLGQYKTMYRQSQGHKTLLDTLQGQNPSVSVSTRSARWQDVQSVMGGLASLGLPGLKPTDLARLLPDDEMTPGLEIMANVRAYYKGMSIDLLLGDKT